MKRKKRRNNKGVGRLTKRIQDLGASLDDFTANLALLGLFLHCVVNLGDGVNDCLTQVGRHPDNTAELVLVDSSELPVIVSLEELLCVLGEAVFFVQVEHYLGVIRWETHCEDEMDCEKRSVFSQPSE